MNRTTLMGAGCALALAFAGPLSAASAQSNDDLRRKVEALEAALAELRAQMEAEASQTDDQIIRIQERVEAAAVQRTTRADDDGFAMGDTVIKFGGIIDLDVNVTDTSDGEIAGSSIARDFYIPSATPIGGVGEGSPDTDFTAEATRFYFTTATERDGREIGTRIELDFLGSGQGNELVSNSYSPRLRHAFVEIDNVLLGQTWSTFQNTSSIPESASFLALSDGMVFVRQPQVRYTYDNWQFAIENPNTREIGTGAVDDGFAPDVVAKYTSSGDFGNVSVAALGRALVDERPDGAGGTTEENAFGWGLSVAGDVKISDGAGVKFSLTGGEGVGRYIGLAAIGDARFDANGELEPISSVGGLVALHADLGAKTRGTFGYSGLFADAELGETESVQSLVGVLAYDLAPKTTVAAELMFGRRTIEAAPGVDDEGDITRLTVSTKHAF